MVLGDSLAHDTSCPGVGNWAMSSPTSAMMAWAARRPIPATSSRRSTTGSAAARISPVWGSTRSMWPGTDRAGPMASPAAAPWPPPGSRAGGLAAGIAAIACSILVVSRSIWPSRASIWSSSILASSPWWASKRPVNAATSAACLPRSRPLASPASTLGSRWPAMSASSMARPETPMMSVATLDSLIRASSSSLLQPLLVAGAVGGQVGPQPGVVPQPAGLGGRGERGPQHAPPVQLGQPHRIQLVGLGPPRQVLDVTRVDQPHHQPPRLQHIDERPPIVGGGLHHDPLDPLAGQLVGQLQDLVGGRGDLPDPGAALARPGGMRHAGADHPGRLGDIDRGDPFHDLLVVFDLDLLACWHRPSSSITGRRRAAQR